MICSSCRKSRPKKRNPKKEKEELERTLERLGSSSWLAEQKLVDLHWVVTKFNEAFPRICRRLSTQPMVGGYQLPEMPEAEVR